MTPPSSAWIVSVSSNQAHCSIRIFLPSDYGYKRDSRTQKCVEDTWVSKSKMDICIDGEEEQIETQVG